MEGGNFWQKLFEDSQEQNRVDTNMEINGNDHQTLNYLSVQPGFSMGPSTADTDLEVNDNNHQALDSLQVQPGSSDFSPDKATTKPQMNDKSHQTFDYLSAQQGSFQAAETPCRNNRVRKSPEGFDYLTSEKKRLADKAYREKSREERENTKAENNRLKTEINRLNEECVRKNHALKSQEEENKHLQQKVGRLEGSLNTQNIVVEVLTKQLAQSQIIDLQRENTLLKSQMDQLTSCANNQDNSIILQLQERNEQLRRENIAFKMIFEALCMKINNDKNHEEEHTR
ncbi:PREDICTED: golgin subfamily A member 8A-like isoform X2 [Populus euphratica]|uniref:Golgin subfamily A member 8A-like isoform X2 n=1 Tax=Populus euphratica TaxID=75702 RepID=A0AAJ6XPX3_POPEU|nr:PREDICTED: golgin subfamily A member 8A-like isoform X2 [Populus euphratica]